MARPAGLEPADAGVKVLCLTCLATAVCGNEISDILTLLN